MKTDQEITNLVLYGKVASGAEDDEVIAINLLKNTAKNHPDVLWSAIFEAFNYENFGMAIPAMAAYLCCPSNSIHFNQKIKKYFIDILKTLNPVSLLDLTEYIKSKVFGAGLGARNQKLLRGIIEGWSEETLKEYGGLYPDEMYSLIRLLHPRINGSRGIIIQSITNKKI